MKLEYIGIDDWDLHTYKDENGRFWKDNTPSQDAYTSLYTVSPNAYDGELNRPLSCFYSGDIEIEFIGGRVTDSLYKRDYMLLGRLQSDCDYFLGNGNRFEPHLWAKTVKEQIEKMKELWTSLPKKPEWLTWEQILEYESQMS